MGPSDTLKTSLPPFPLRVPTLHLGRLRTVQYPQIVGLTTPGSKNKTVSSKNSTVKPAYLAVSDHYSISTLQVHCEASATHQALRRCALESKCEMWVLETGSEACTPRTHHIEVSPTDLEGRGHIVHQLCNSRQHCHRLSEMIREGPPYPPSLVSQTVGYPCSTCHCAKVRYDYTGQKRR